MFRLAGHLGRTVGELELSLSSRELSEWIAYSSFEPFGQGRSDDGFRLLASMLYNINRGKNARPLSADDFLKTLHDSKPKPKGSGALAAELKAAFGGLKANPTASA